MMKILRLLSISYFAFIIVGCNTTSSPIVELSERIKNLSYDSTIMHTSLDGFRIQISPRMAKQIAEERGYKIDSFFSSVTFDDIIEAGFKERRVQETICLERYDGEENLHYEIMLHFDYGKVESVQLGHKFSYQQQRAEEMFESYLKRFPQLTIEKEEENIRVYSYKPNERANITLILEFFPISKDKGISRVSIYVSDINYTASKIYQEAYR